MDDYQSLSHTRWECKYHVVFIPKYRRKALFGQLRQHLGNVFRKLAEQKECSIEQGHIMVDHVHMLISIPPKHQVSQVVGFIKGKSAIHIARTYSERKRNFQGEHFWARGYFVSTVGRDEVMAMRAQRLGLLRTRCPALTRGERGDLDPARREHRGEGGVRMMQGELLALGMSLGSPLLAPCGRS